MGEITIRKALDDYKTIHLPYRNFAERTREEYLNDLEDVTSFVEQAGLKNTGELSVAIIERYVSHLEGEGFASRTRKRRVASIRSFLSFLYQDGYIATDIAKRVVLPFTESTIPQVLTQAECDRLRIACFDNPRDLAIIELILQTGMKLAELVRLTLDDVEFEKTGDVMAKLKGSIRIRASRGKKERMIPLNSKASIALKNYLDLRPDSGNLPLFINRLRKPLGERGVQKLIRKYLEQIGLKKASVHTLRHSFGFHHAIQGTSAKTIQEVMGHKNSRSTSIYFDLAKTLVAKELQQNAL